MINLNRLRYLKEKTIKNIFLKVELTPIDTMFELDMYLGLVLEENDNELFVIHTDPNDLCTPILYTESVPSNYLDSILFEQIIKEIDNWPDDKSPIQFFDFTKSPYFNDIVGQKINEVQLIYVDSFEEPIGVKLVFNKNYITSSPGSIDGYTIETKDFNKNNCFKIYDNVGEIYFVTL